MKHKILLVDDEPDILEFMEYNLRKENYEVSKASNGREAIQKAKKENPDLIILDIMMPEQDGIETCRQLREIPDFKNTLIAFLTARNEDYSQIAGFDVGADDYITKPIKPRVLVSRINALFRRYEKIKALATVRSCRSENSALTASNTSFTGALRNLYCREKSSSCFPCLRQNREKFLHGMKFLSAFGETTLSLATARSMFMSASCVKNLAMKTSRP
jgi:DNA-binding response OmpR family regulator